LGVTHGSTSNVGDIVLGCLNLLGLYQVEELEELVLVVGGG
jgi:hypothetical protein